jgi:hypothetical protein
MEVGSPKLPVDPNFNVFQLQNERKTTSGKGSVQEPITFEDRV